MENQEKIKMVGMNMTKLLLEKNKRYGDAALSPIGIFSKHVSPDTPNVNSILIRLDDKIQRIKNSNELRKNDISDLNGYLQLLCVAKNWLNFDDLID